MISLNKINIEYKSTVLFGFTALFLSFLIGILAGIRWNIIILRSILLMAVFAAIGFGVCIILRKFVPEVYGFLTAIPVLGMEEEPGEQPVIETPGDMETSYAGGEERAETVPMADGVEAPLTDDFKELEKDGLTHYSTASGGGSGVHTASGKLGKHILEKEKLAKYEPKIMAQAVRTMMSKDRE